MTFKLRARRHDEKQDLPHQAGGRAVRTATRSALDRGAWIDPRHGVLTLADYTEQWMAERHYLRLLRTVELYDGLSRNHILPAFNRWPWRRSPPVPCGHGTPSWPRSTPRRGRRCIALLRQIMSTAVADELIGRNPCVVQGAGQQHAPERPVLSIAEVHVTTEGDGPRAQPVLRFLRPGAISAWRDPRPRAPGLRPLARNHPCLSERPMRLAAVSSLSTQDRRGRARGRHPSPHPADAGITPSGLRWP